MKDYNKLLFPYAYNILGSTEDAKDVIQDVLEKFLSVKKDDIRNEKAYLIRSAINSAINLKKKKKRQIENSVWLPEPIVTEPETSRYDRDKIISYSMMVLLESLTAKERAVFILKNAFDYSHKDIASVIDSTVENSRKLLSRASKKVNVSDTQVNQGHHRSDISAYVDAIQSGDVGLVERLLSEEISLYADGGKDIKVVRELTCGKAQTLDLLLYVYHTYQQSLKVTLTLMNHQPALIYTNEERLINCQVFEYEGDKIVNVYSVVDPAKLKHLSRFV